MRSTLSFLMITFFLGSCGRTSDVNIDQDVHIQVNGCNDNSMIGNVKYSYTYSEARSGYTCTTNCHIAQSLTDYCAHLRDDALNNYCARDERQSAFNDAHCE